MAWKTPWSYNFHHFLTTTLSLTLNYLESNSYKGFSMKLAEKIKHYQILSNWIILSRACYIKTYSLKVLSEKSIICLKRICLIVLSFSQRDCSKVPFIELSRSIPWMMALVTLCLYNEESYYTIKQWEFTEEFAKLNSLTEIISKNSTKTQIIYTLKGRVFIFYLQKA